jgi:hypothetical protein
MDMNRIVLVTAFILIAGILAGCAPMLTVENKTGFEIRVFISEGGGSTVLSPSPGESSSAEVSVGRFTAAAVPSQDWIDYATATRQYLNDRLAHSEDLTGAQLLDVIQRLKDIATRMQQYENSAGKGGSCSGSVTENNDGLVVVSVAADGSLAVTCGSGQ